MRLGFDLVVLLFCGVFSVLRQDAGDETRVGKKVAAAHHTSDLLSMKLR
jgi:hypothetical protein